MAHTVIRDISPEPEPLILFMDGDNNLTADKKTLDKVYEKRQTTEVKIIRVLASTADSDDSDNDEDDTRPKMKLTLEEILPENAVEDSKVGESSGPPDIVDPLLQLDTQAIQKLKKALASEQAKQILGDNVTAMLDVLSVEDPANFIKNSIRRDHCYTQLSPNADPKGPSFVNVSVGSSITQESVPKSELSKPSSSGLVKKVTQVDDAAPDAGSNSDNDSLDEGSHSENEMKSSDRSSDSDYHDRNSGYRRGRRKIKRFIRPSTGRGRGRGRISNERPQETYSEESEVVDNDRSPVAQTVQVRQRGRPRKEQSRQMLSNSSSSNLGVIPPPPVDNVAAKVLSADAIRLGRPSIKSDEERKRDMARILEKLDSNKNRKIVLSKPNPQSSIDVKANNTNVPLGNLLTPQSAVVSSEVLKTPVKIVSKPTAGYIDPLKQNENKEVRPSQNVMGGKYPRRENRKLPSHLADTIIFSSPDSLRRKEDIKVKPIIVKPPVKKKEDEVVQDTLLSEYTQEDVEVPSVPDTLTELENMLEEGLEKVTNDSESDGLSILQPAPTPVEIQPSPEEKLSPAIVKSGKEIVSEMPSKRLSFEQALLGTSPPTRPATVVNSEPEHVEEAPDITNDMSKDGNSDVAVEEVDSDIDDALSEASWNSEDDPDKLWCICRKPHNNRFMICCDNCEDWFHGKCVGITKSIGKQMEQDGLDWTCPPCSKKKRAAEKEKEIKVAVKVTKPTDLKPSIQTKLSLSRKCIMCNGAVRENSIYCSDECIGKHSQKALAQFNATKAAIEKPAGIVVGVAQKPPERHVTVMNANSREVLTGPSAPTISNLASWLKQNPNYHVVLQKGINKDDPGRKILQLQRISVGNLTAGKAIVSSTTEKTAMARPVVVTAITTTPKPPVGQTQLTISPNSKQLKFGPRTTSLIKVVKPQAVSVVRKTYVKDLGESLQKPKTLPTAPVESPKIVKKDQIVVQPTKRKRKEKLDVLTEFTSPKAAITKMEEVRKDSSSDKAVRESVKKTLGDVLKVRVADAKDLKIKDVDIEALAVKIEERLYKHFDNKVDTKYKSKFRSLQFNIKDLKNETLFRKIVENAISPKQLVRLTPEEMASQELAQWREKEKQHQLEMIKKTELELMTQGQTFIVKSHKGEEVLEKDSKVAALVAEIDPNTSAKELVSALNSVSSTTDNDVKEKSETSLMKMKKKDSERKRSRDDDRRHKSSHSSSRSKKSKSSRKRSRSRSRDRHHRSKDRKSSRSSRHSRDRHKSRDKDKEKKEDGKDGNDESILIDNTAKDHKEPERCGPLLSDEADYEPTSTVIIKTPELIDEPTSTVSIVTPEMLEEADAGETEPDILWAGDIELEKVAKLTCNMVHVAGDSESLADMMHAKEVPIGRIDFETVVAYLDKLKAMKKETTVVQFVAEEGHLVNLLSIHRHYLNKEKLGVIKARGNMKDFYLYPYKIGSPLPSAIENVQIPVTNQGDDVLLGLVVMRQAAGQSSSRVRPPPPHKIPYAPLALPKTIVDVTPLPEITPDKRRPSSPKHSSRKRKVKVSVAIASEGTPPVDDGDSPYEPASDDDLPSLSKMPKKSVLQYQPQTISNPNTEQIRKKIEETDREIAALYASAPVSSIDIPLPPSTPPPALILPNESSGREEVMDVDERSTHHPVIPQEIAIPANLHEILASIQQVKPAAEALAADSSSEEIVLVESPTLSSRDSAVDDTSKAPLKSTKKKLDVAEVFESSRGMKSKQIKFDLKLKSSDIDDRVINLEDNSALPLTNPDQGGSAADKDYRLMPRIITGAVDIPLPSSSHPEDKSRLGRRKSDSDERRSQFKDPLEGEWDCDIRHYEGEQRRRNQIIREKEIEMLKKRVDEE